MGQMAKAMINRESGTLPSNTVVNPKETYKAITQRCGKAYYPPKMPELENEGCSNELFTEDSTTIEEIPNERRHQVSGDKERKRW